MRQAKQWKQLKTRIETIGARFRFGSTAAFESQAAVGEWNHMSDIWRALDDAWQVMARARFANALANCVTEEYPVLCLGISFEEMLSDEGGTYWSVDVTLRTPISLSGEEAVAYRNEFDWIDSEPYNKFEFLSEAFDNEDQQFTVTLDAARQLFASQNCEAFFTEILSDSTSY